MQKVQNQSVHHQTSPQNGFASLDALQTFALRNNLRFKLSDAWTDLADLSPKLAEQLVEQLVEQLAGLKRRFGDDISYYSVDVCGKSASKQANGNVHARWTKIEDSSVLLKSIKETLAGNESVFEPELPPLNWMEKLGNR